MCGSGADPPLERAQPGGGLRAAVGAEVGRQHRASPAGALLAQGAIEASGARGIAPRRLGRGEVGLVPGGEQAHPRVALAEAAEVARGTRSRWAAAPRRATSGRRRRAAPPPSPRAFANQASSSASGRARRSRPRRRARACARAGSPSRGSGGRAASPAGCPRARSRARSAGRRASPPGRSSAARAARGGAEGFSGSASSPQPSSASTASAGARRRIALVLAGPQKWNRPLSGAIPKRSNQDGQGYVP